MRLIKEKSAAGFTLTELLVTTSIIFIMSAAVVINYESGKGQLSIQRSTNKLAQDIRRAQEMAMSAKECPVGTGCQGNIPYGYGIFAVENETQYILYADTQPSPGGDEYYTLGPPEDDMVETIDLENGVVICDIQKTGGGVGPDQVSINFRPPDPKVKIQYSVGQVENFWVEIILGTDCVNPANNKKVTVNAVGLVEVE